MATKKQIHGFIISEKSVFQNGKFQTPVFAESIQLTTRINSILEYLQNKGEVGIEFSSRLMPGKGCLRFSSLMLVLCGYANDNEPFVRKQKAYNATGEEIWCLLIYK